MHARIALSLAWLLVLGWTPSARAQVPAFRGAEGFGASTTGGRGGRIIHVTTLNAEGPGSLGEAVATPGPRIVVFDVSGVIDGDITITESDVTIAGQTAPGAGITIRGRLFAEYDEDIQNIVIRHLRIRPRACDGCDAEVYDGVQISLNSRVILDHLSIGFGADETLDLYEADDVTVQWCTIEEAQYDVEHPSGVEHNYGLIHGPDGHRISIHHTLFAHVSNRAPAVANGPAEIVDNVIYDVRIGFVHHNDSTGSMNILGNSYLGGPSARLHPIYFDDEDPSTVTRYYLNDNYIDVPGAFTGRFDDPWTSSYYTSEELEIGADVAQRLSMPVDYSGEAGHVPLTVESAEAARAHVLERAGAFPRDSVTRRVVMETETRTGAWGAHIPTDLLEGLTATAPPTDADRDGMADTWERANGLDPADADDHRTVLASGFTAIETYLDELSDELVGAPAVTPVDGGVNADGGVGADAGATGPMTDAGGDRLDAGSAVTLDASRADAGAPATGSGCSIVATTPRSDSQLLIFGMLSLAVAARRTRRRRATLSAVALLSMVGCTSPEAPIDAPLSDLGHVVLVDAPIDTTSTMPEDTRVEPPVDAPFDGGAPIDGGPSDGSFTFLVYGDSRSGGGCDGNRIHRSLVTQMAAEPAQMVFHLGDMITGFDRSTNWTNNGDCTDPEAPGSFASLIAPLSDRTPSPGLPMFFFPVIGNHDDGWGDGWYPDEFGDGFCDVFDPRLFVPNHTTRPYFRDPRAPHFSDDDFYRLACSTTDRSVYSALLYYSFDFENAHFAVMSFNNEYLDLEECNECGADRANYDDYYRIHQLDWLRADLDAADARPEIEHLFLLAHVPLFTTSDGHDGSGSWPAVSQILSAHHADIAFSGHNHVYERSHPILGSTAAPDGVRDDAAGTVYTVSGGGGSDLHGFRANDPRMAVRADDHHYLRVEVTGGAVSVTAIGTDGGTVDHYEVIR